MKQSSGVQICPTIKACAWSCGGKTLSQSR